LANDPGLNGMIRLQRDIDYGFCSHSARSVTEPWTEHSNRYSVPNLAAPIPGRVCVHTGVCSGNFPGSTRCVKGAHVVSMSQTWRGGVTWLLCFKGKVHTVGGYINSIQKPK